MLIIIFFLQVSNIHVDLRRIIVEDWLTIPGQDKFKQRAMDILDRWEKLLLAHLDDYCWARVASNHLSLVYVPKDKRHGERYFPAYKEMFPYPIRYFI